MSCFSLLNYRCKLSWVIYDQNLGICEDVNMTILMNKDRIIMIIMIVEYASFMQIANIKKYAINMHYHSNIKKYAKQINHKIYTL